MSSTTNFVGTFNNSPQQYESIGSDGLSQVRTFKPLYPGCNSGQPVQSFTPIALRRGYQFLPIGTQAQSSMTQHWSQQQSLENQQIQSALISKSNTFSSVETSVPESRRQRLEAAEPDDAIVRNLVTNTVYQHPLLVAYSQK